MLLGLDVGITGTRALAIDESGTVRASAFVGYGIHRPRPGWTEQDPLEWWAAAQEALARVAGEVGGVGLVGGEVTAIGLSGQMSGSVFLNAAGELIRPALLWNDRRTGAQCTEITERIGAARLIELGLEPGDRVAYLRAQPSRVDADRPCLRVRRSGLRPGVRHEHRRSGAPHPRRVRVPDDLRRGWRRAGQGRRCPR